jgi:hypothetical protein
MLLWLMTWFLMPNRGSRWMYKRAGGMRDPVSVDTLYHVQTMSIRHFLGSLHICNTSDNPSDEMLVSTTDGSYQDCT